MVEFHLLGFKGKSTLKAGCKLSDLCTFSSEVSEHHVYSISFIKAINTHYKLGPGSKDFSDTPQDGWQRMCDHILKQILQNKAKKKPQQTKQLYMITYQHERLNEAQDPDSLPVFAICL